MTEAPNEERISPAPGRIRVLSIDGGGIYGLATAIWLRRLCELNDQFLDGTDVRLFAGTSAGALNCLLLAAHEVPREAVLGGVLERFWGQSGIFSNTDPWRAWMSLFGFGGWFSDQDFLSLLRRTFGDLTLGQLPQQVLVSTFNWTGATSAPRRSRAGQVDHWRPKFFDNAEDDDEDNARSVVDVAYAAATPPTLRPMFKGFGDGGTFSGNPTLPAIAHIKRQYRLERNGLDGADLVISRKRGSTPQVSSVQDMAGLLSRITVLSVGSGQQLPRLGTGDVDLGLMFSYAPTDPTRGNFWPTSSFSIDPATEEAEYIVKELLGRSRALRLNPPVLDVPAVTAAVLSRNESTRQWLAQQIRTKAEGEPSTSAVNAVDQFLRSVYGWDCKGATDHANWTPARKLSDRASTHAPALATLGDDSLYMAWKGLECREMNLWVSTAGDCDALWSDQHKAFFVEEVEGDDWVRAKVSPAHMAISSPALAYCERGTVLVMAWTCESEHAIHVSIGHPGTFREDDRTKERRRWGPPQLVPGRSTTEHPTLAVLPDGRLFVARRTEGQAQITVGILVGDGIEWEEPQPMTPCCASPPALAVSDDGVVGAVWGDGEGTITIASWSDDCTWQARRTLEMDLSRVEEGLPAPGIVGCPALAFACGRWHMAWRGPDDHVWLAVSAGDDLERWLPPVPLLDRWTSSRPVLARVRNARRDATRLMMAWRWAEGDDLDHQNLWVASLPMCEPEDETSASG